MHYALSVVCRPSVVFPSLTFHIFDFSSETAKQNSTKLDRKQDFNVFYQLCGFFLGGAIGKIRWQPLPLIGWDIFHFSSETAEQNLTKLDRKQDLNVLYQVCVFRVDRKNKMAALASDWLRHFPLLLCNHWTEFDETWQEARFQRPLQSLCFFGPIGKIRCQPWPLIGWDIFDFSSETAERNSTKLDRKQDLNVLYEVCVFRADRKNKMATLASDWLRHFRLLHWNRWTTCNETWQEERSQRPLPRLCFWADRNKMAALAKPSKRWHIVLRCTICGPLGLLFLVSWGMNRSAGQTNRVNRIAVLEWFTMLPTKTLSKILREKL